jgi:hypothetical protein
VGFVARLKRLSHEIDKEEPPKGNKTISSFQDFPVEWSRYIRNPLAKELISTSFAEVLQYLSGKFAKSIESKLELLPEGTG